MPPPPARRIDTDRGVDVHLSVASHPGRARPTNQDSFLVVDMERWRNEPGVLFERPPSEADVQYSGEFVLGAWGALLCVADGMGGAAGGGVASQIASETTREFMARAWGSVDNPDRGALGRHIREALQRCNTRIRQRIVETPELDGMGTTATLAALFGDGLYLAQVGDSRAYLLRGEEIRQLTRDQSFVQHMVDSGVPRHEAEESTHRHVLLQALGTQPRVEVDLTYQRLRDGDVIFLCSDGLSNQVRPEEMARIMGVTPDPAVACRSLVSLANERGGPDNITLIICAVTGDLLGSPSPEDVVGYQPFRPSASEDDTVPDRLIEPAG
ncbi:MAG: serine/threonine-protein phosphatase [Gemmatimonadetes bacterium]|nr:serine/threonine-protein phosphatase [Gemmatimonadota bacterium]